MTSFLQGCIKRIAKLAIFFRIGKLHLLIFINFPTFVFMKNIKSSIQGYIIAFLIFQLAVSGFVIRFSRLDQMQLINLHHSVFLDVVLLGLTQSAEVILPILFLFYLIWKQRKLVKPYVFSYLISTAIVQLLKHVIFSDALRPILYLKSVGIKWHLLEGLPINELNSFPSGHTNAAWWMYFWLAYLMPSRFTGFLFGLCAFGVAYSRVYLFQHFPVDTLWGAFFGMLGSFSMYYLLILKKNAHA